MLDRNDLKAIGEIVNAAVTKSEERMIKRIDESIKESEERKIKQMDESIKESEERMIKRMDESIKESESMLLDEMEKYYDSSMKEVKMIQKRVDNLENICRLNQSETETLHIYFRIVDDLQERVTILEKSSR